MMVVGHSNHDVKLHLCTLAKYSCVTLHMRITLNAESLYCIMVHAFLRQRAWMTKGQLRFLLTCMAWWDTFEEALLREIFAQ